MAANPQPVIALVEPMETIWFPIDGFALACDVCGETGDTLYMAGDLIVCGQHREAK